MSARDSILARIRTVTAAIPAKVPLPDYDPAITHCLPRLEGDDLTAVFARNLGNVNGRAMRSAAEVARFLSDGGYRHGYCDPALHAVIGPDLAAAGLTVETTYDRGRYDDYQFGITRASGAIAESGTIILDDNQTSSRLAALSPWVHVAVLDAATIHRTIADALAALGDSPNVIWATGPSKTADVEGILIEGVHGPGEQIALIL
ncbi:MAG: LUD domain-containing protein [Verrucomicrobia bacterium]|nr:LUD domain-containing protein [Verrucomicrobiota bacterium]